jgi:thiamine kinase-like enzyme
MCSGAARLGLIRAGALPVERMGRRDDLVGGIQRGGCLVSASEDRIRALPIWRGRIDIAPLEGGLSNECWLVTDASGRHVVRIGRDYPFHHVLRQREAMTARAAHEAGFAPELRYADGGVMVTAFIEARALGAADIPARIGRIVPLVRRFHAEMPRHVSGPGFMFWPFHVIRDYARTLAAGNSRMADELPRYLALAEELERVQAPLPIVFGHNDLLPANFLDDGERLWLIDFEYAGFSTAMFDLAGLVSNANIAGDAAEAVLELYFGGSPPPGLRRSHAAMQCASLLREAMWSMVSELHLSAPGVDYVAYTRENLEKLEEALDHYRARYGRD